MAKFHDEVSTTHDCCSAVYNDGHLPLWCRHVILMK